MKRFKTLFDMKLELKALAAQIKKDKEPPRSQHTRAMFEFRHLHVARCLLKGRTMLEIEGSDTNRKSKRDEKYLAKLLEKWTPLHEAEQIAWKAANLEMVTA